MRFSISLSAVKKMTVLFSNISIFFNLFKTSIPLNLGIWRSKSIISGRIFEARLIAFSLSRQTDKEHQETPFSKWPITWMFFWLSSTARTLADPWFSISCSKENFTCFLLLLTKWILQFDLTVGIIQFLRICLLFWNPKQTHDSCKLIYYSIFLRRT